MKKRLLISLIILIAVFQASSQVIRCDHETHWNDLIKSPDFRALQEDFEQRRKQPNLSKSQSVFVVPVVVHVIYKNSAENIPDNQILSQLSVLKP